MLEFSEIQVRSVEDGGHLWLSLHHTVVSLRWLRQGCETRMDIPIESLQVMRKKRVNAVWGAWFLITLIFGSVAGLLLALVAVKAFSVEPEPNRVTLPIVLAGLLPAAFFFFRIWMRDPLVEFVFGEDKGSKIQFWLPLKPARCDVVEAVLAEIESVRSETSEWRDMPVCETDMPSSVAKRILHWVWAEVLFCLPAVTAEKAWLFALALIPAAWAMAEGIRWLRLPKLLREAERLRHLRRWEESLACLERFVQEKSDQKGELLMERLDLLRRLGRFDEACALLDAHLSLIGPETYRALQDDLRLAWRVRQRKGARPTGGWLLTKPV